MIKQNMPTSSADDRDAESFVEIDPTGRFGRYSDLLRHDSVKKVYRAFDQEEGIEVAWSQVRLANFGDDHLFISRLFSEVKLLSTLKNTYILVCHSVWTNDEHHNLNFIAEVCTSGNLRNYRKKHRHVSTKALFRRIGSLRKQGMKEKYVSSLLVFYANNSVLLNDFDESESDEMVPTILQGLIHLLPMEEKAGRMIPMGFYLVLLSRCLDFGLTSEVVEKLQDQVASMLHLAHLDELIFPKIELDFLVSCSIELATMEAIFSANLWDACLAYIASDRNLSRKSFMKTRRNSTTVAQAASRRPLPSAQQLPSEPPRHNPRRKGCSLQVPKLPEAIAGSMH